MIGKLSNKTRNVPLCLLAAVLLPACCPCRAFKNLHTISMSCQLWSPCADISGRVTSALRSHSHHQSLIPSLKARSSVSSSHYAQTWHETNSRSWKQRHISPIPRVYVCVSGDGYQSYSTAVYCFKVLLFSLLVIRWPELTQMESKEQMKDIQGAWIRETRRESCSAGVVQCGA